ncbi:ABC transporter permease [Duganella qianjiadongensis]|uniref:FtsX-like permease family protein n=1 Tax=Duganella qianjiadongensis TaxID=2692176 RepID=A0ABW9VRI2_9BURK|nr:FtsX-like permease family protein [Duganella qianjiadongensis]MYM41851.1 FtsX-like permease family protein [Duganella qianjiadongensis]
MRIEFPWLGLALKNAMRNRRRSLVTLAIAATGTAAALLGGGFALYTYQSLAEASARDTGHVIVAAPHYFDGAENSPLEFGLENSTGLAQNLLARPEVKRVLPRLQFSGLIGNGERSEIFIGTGVDPQQEFLVKGPFMQTVTGEMLDARPADKGPGIVLGKILARTLNARPGSGLTLMSSTVTGALSAVDVTVTGIVSTGIADLDKRLVMVDISTAQTLLATSKVSSLHVYLNAMDDTAGVTAQLRQETAGKLEVRDWLQMAQFYQSVKDLYNRIFGFLGIIVLVIVLFAVGNTLAMAVMERTREIGTLRAMGATPAEVTRVFTLEGMSLGAAGAVSGMLLAALIAYLLLVLKVQMPPPPGRSSGYPLVIELSPQLFLVAGIAVTALSALASLLVSRKAAQQSVVEALSHV